MATLRWKGSRESLRRAIQSIPATLAGVAPDPLGIHGIFWIEIANGLLGLIETDFRAKSQGAATATGRWAALAESTLERRHRKGITTDDVLIETTRLLKSLAPGFGDQPSGAPGQVLRVGTNGVTVGTEVPYADWHQQGVPGRTPARKIVPDGPLPAEWERELERICGVALMKVIERIVSNSSP